MPVEVFYESQLQRRRAGAAPVPARPLTDRDRKTWTSHSPKIKRPSARSRDSSSSTAPPPNTSPSSKPARSATTPRCGANWRRRICSASRCPNPSAEAAAASSSSALLLSRGRLERRARTRSTRRWCSAPTPLRDTAIRTLQQRYLPGVVDGSSILTGALAEPANSDPDRAAHHRPPRRRRLAARRHQDAGARGAARQRDRRLGADRRRRRTVRRRHRRQRRRRSRRCATTNGEPHADVVLTGAVGTPTRRSTTTAISSAALYARALVGLCAMQVGVTERALRLAASYTTNASSSAGPSDRSRPSSSAWPTPSSTSRPSAGPRGMRRG